MFDERPSPLVSMEIRAACKGLRSGNPIGVLYYARPSFVARLKAIDPLLSVHWNRIRQRWQIWRKSETTGAEVVVMTVGGEEYQTLDDRVIVALKRADAWSRGRKVLDEAEEAMREEVDKAERERDAEDEAWLKEEAYPRLRKDLSTEVSHSKAGLSVGGLNIPKEDLLKMGLSKRRRNRVAAGAAPKHLTPGPLKLEHDLIVEAE